MNKYLILIRGINVGGKNKVPMAQLRDCLEKLDFRDVSTFIASGNVILKSDKPVHEVRRIIEAALPMNFRLDSELIKVLVMTPGELENVVKRKPKGFGDQPAKYHSDAIFLIDIDETTAMTVFSPREGVDNVWQGKGVIYSQRLSVMRTKSRLGKIVGTEPYKSMTIRSWNTTVRLLNLIKNR